MMKYSDWYPALIYIAAAAHGITLSHGQHIRCHPRNVSGKLDVSMANYVKE